LIWKKSEPTPTAETKRPCFVPPGTLQKRNCASPKTRRTLRGRQPAWQTNHKSTSKQANKQTNKHTNKQPNKQTNKQTKNEIENQKITKEQTNKGAKKQTHT